METEDAKINIKVPKEKKSKIKEKPPKETKEKTPKEKKPKPEKEEQPTKKVKKEPTPKKAEESEKKCKRGYKFCKNKDCDEMVHIHSRVCPKCNFEFEMKAHAKEEVSDAQELEKLISKKKKTKKDAVAEESGGPDMRIIKKAFYRVRELSDMI
jgi:acetyl-CoA carboxylase beta subunit